MKIAGLCLLLALGAIARADDADPHAAIREKCKNEFGISDEELKAAIKDPSGMGCFLFCFLKALSIMGDDGVFDPDMAMDGIEESAKEVARPIIFSCSDKEMQSPTEGCCNRALEVIQCVKDEGPDLYKNLGFFHPLDERQE